MTKYDSIKVEKKPYSKDQLRRIEFIEKDIKVISQVKSSNPRRWEIHKGIIEAHEREIKKIKLEQYDSLCNHGTIVYPDPETGIYDLTESNINGKPSKNILDAYFPIRYSNTYTKKEEPKKIKFSDLVSVGGHKYIKDK